MPIRTTEENDLILSEVIKKIRELDLNELEKRNKEAKERLSIESASMIRISLRMIDESQSQISLLDNIISVGKQLNRR